MLQKIIYIAIVVIVSYSYIVIVTVIVKTIAIYVYTCNNCNLVKSTMHLELNLAVMTSLDMTIFDEEKR